MGVPSTMSVGQDQSELSEVTALSRFALQARVLVVLALELGERQRVDRRQIQMPVRTVVLLQVLIEPEQAGPLVSMPSLACDLAPQEATQSILEATQVARMHAVNDDVIQQEPWALEEARRILGLHGAALEVLTVGDQGLAVLCLRQQRNAISQHQQLHDDTKQDSRKAKTSISKLLVCGTAFSSSRIPLPRSRGSKAHPGRWWRCTSNRTHLMCNTGA
jgi:hypothetical protein